MTNYLSRILLLCYMTYLATSAFDGVGQSFPANTLTAWDAASVVFFMFLAMGIAYTAGRESKD